MPESSGIIRCNREYTVAMQRKVNVSSRHGTPVPLPAPKLPKLPIEIYSSERQKEFDKIESELARRLKQRARPTGAH
jgi:hypothetical protein